MAKKYKAAGKKRDSQQAAAGEPKQAAKKAKQAAAEEPPVTEEESEELDMDEFEDVSDLGEDEDDAEPTPAQLWQLQLEKRATELNAFVCLVGDLDKEAEEQQKQKEKEKASKAKKDGGDGDEGEDSSEDEEDEDEEPSVERLEAMTRLFLPKKTEEYLDSLLELLHQIGTTPPSSEDEGDGGDEDEDGMDKEQRRMMLALMMPRMLNTKHSLPMQALLKDDLGKVDKAMKSKHWEEALCRWAAVLLAATDEEHWYADTEDSDAVAAIWKQLSKQWGQLKSHSLKDLGNPSCEGGKSPDVKATLGHMLHRLGERIKDLGVYDI